MSTLDFDSLFWGVKPVGSIFVHQNQGTSPMNWRFWTDQTWVLSRSLSFGDEIYPVMVIGMVWVNPIWPRSPEDLDENPMEFRQNVAEMENPRFPVDSGLFHCHHQDILSKFQSFQSSGGVLETPIAARRATSMVLKIIWDHSDGPFVAKSGELHTRPWSIWSLFSCGMMFCKRASTQIE